ncbi:MAG: hypothetical protein BRC22_01865, partial [Parcubacteria group bacterium QH_9_35_7]
TQYDIFFAQLGKKARHQTLKLLSKLRKEGIKVHNNLAKEALRDQLETANDLEVDHALILGQKEANNNNIILRDMETGNQETISQENIVSEVKNLID